YARLRARFPDWRAVLEAPVDEVEEAIRPGGISRVKSRRIQSMLAAIAAEAPPGQGPAPHHNRPSGALAPDGSTVARGSRSTSAPRLDLDFLAAAPREEAIEFLERLPGVGRKTAACVLLFSFDRPEFPVDTHVYRVASRLGLIRPKASFEEAHDVLGALSDPENVYELHVNMIRHGRRICAARNPRCTECPLLRLCPYGRERVRAS